MATGVGEHLRLNAAENNNKHLHKLAKDLSLSFIHATT
jgi:hypothetical protein